MFLYLTFIFSRFSHLQIFKYLFLQNDYLKLLFCFRPLLKQIKNSAESHIVLDCSTERIYDVLKQAQQIGMMSDYHSYLITSLVSTLYATNAINDPFCSSWQTTEIIRNRNKAREIPLGAPIVELIFGAIFIVRAICGQPFLTSLLKVHCAETTWRSREGCRRSITAPRIFEPLVNYR